MINNPIKEDISLIKEIINKEYNNLLNDYNSLKKLDNKNLLSNFNNIKEERDLLLKDIKEIIEKELGL